MNCDRRVIFVADEKETRLNLALDRLERYAFHHKYKNKGRGRRVVLQWECSSFHASREEKSQSPFLVIVHANGGLSPSSSPIQHGPVAQTKTKARQITSESIPERDVGRQDALPRGCRAPLEEGLEIHLRRHGVFQLARDLEDVQHCHTSKIKAPLSGCAGGR